MALVEVKPIERERWHGYKGKEAFARPVTIRALVNANTGKYSTGLSEEDRKRLETLTGYDLSPNYSLGNPHPFWSSTAAAIKLEHKTNIFNTSNPIEEIKVKVLKASDFVANSQKEFEEGKFPYAVFVIYDETEETEFKAERAAIRRQVIIESEKLSVDRKAEIVQILSGVSVRKQSNSYIDLKIDEMIEEHGAEKVLSLINRDKKKTKLHALILEAIHKGVLRKEGSAIYYMDDQLGFDLESTLEYFSNTQNQALKAQVLEKLNE